MSKRLVRSLEPQIKIISSEKGEVDYVASDASLDCYDEIVVPHGADFSRFKKNAPFVNSHDYHDLRNLLGQVTDYRVENGQVIERVKWAVEANELAALGFRLTEGGFLKAVSIGFMPLRYAYSGGKEFAEMVKELGLSADQTAQCRCIHREWQQIELSACIIGANPNALVRAFKEKAIGEADIAMLGFGEDDDYQLLELTAERFESADLATRFLLTRELERTHRAHRQDKSPTGKRSSTQPPHAPGGGVEAKRQAEEQRAELQELITALKSVPRIKAQS